MNNKVDFFQKKLSNTRSFARQRKTSIMRIWIIVVLILLAGGFACWKLFFAGVNLEDTKIEKFSEFSLGQEVYLQGEIKSNGDIITHTHTIEDENYGIIGIKSDSVNLSDYAGFVQLIGLVEKFYQGNPIVKVLSLSGTVLNTVEDDTNIVLDGNVGVYFKSAGIQLLPSFFDEYVLLNEGENSQILIQNIDSGKEIAIDYFRCNASDPNRNCKGLVETFANNSAQSFVTSEGDVYYKQSEVQSWFVANGDWWGVFINDVSDDVVFELKDLIKFANEKNMNEWIKSRAMKICQGEGEKLQNIKNSEINLKQEGLIVTVSGDGIEKEMTCQILVDFSLPAKGELQSLTIGDDVVIAEEQTQEETQEIEETKPENTEKIDEENKAIQGIISTSAGLDTNVPQFPVREEGLVYTSSRGGYSLHFPSSNISYSVSSISENFGRNDISCSYVINVIKYSDKENLEVSPSARIYECQGTATESRAPEIIVYPRAGKLFVVQLNDGAWNDFAMNLRFETIE